MPRTPATAPRIVCPLPASARWRRVGRVGAGLLVAGLLIAGTQAAYGAPPGGGVLRGTPLPALADTPPGAVAARAVILDPSRRGFQTVNVSAAGGGAVEVYGVPFAPPIPVPNDPAAPVGPAGGTLVRLCVGRIYRMRITDVPGLPEGTALFPSIELVDRLHPPEGLASAFPLPVSITPREAELAAAGALVTKAIYLEHPDLAPVTRFEGPLRRTRVAPQADVLAEGDARGRVIAIVRLGGRTPDLTRPEPAFYGTGGPVLPAAPADVNLPPLPPVTDAVTQVSAVLPEPTDCDTGDCDTGDCDTGDCDTGDCDTGDCDTGDCDTGDCDTGDCDTGDCDTGDCDTGDCDTGDCDTGDCDTGDLAGGALRPSLPACPGEGRVVLDVRLRDDSPLDDCPPSPCPPGSIPARPAFGDRPAPAFCPTAPGSLSHGPPVHCPPGGIAYRSLPPVGGAVLDWRAPGPLCPPEVRPKDEYLCDGGDRGRPAGTTEILGGLGGLDPEDAVVRFRGSDGEVHVCETNRVCVYAPRFAEVSTIFGVVADTSYRGPSDLARTARSSTGVIDLSTGTLRQDVRPDAARVRSRVSGLTVDVPWSALSDVLRRQQNVRYTETLKLIRNSQANLREGLTVAQLAERADAAAVWTRADNPVTFYVGAAVNQAVGSTQPQVMVGVEDKRKPGLLCVRKYADKAFAAPGDVVTFTITVENRGQKPLAEIVILDNLTPRLAYIEGSGESTLEGELQVTPNGEGSGIVRFVLADDLDGGEEGKLTFQTRVR